MTCFDKRVLISVASFLIAFDLVICRGAFALDYILIQIKHRPADELVELVLPLLTESGKVTADLNTNSILVVDERESLERVKEFIARVDRPSKQVRIKAKFFDENGFSDLKLGVNWLYSDDHFTVGNITGTPMGRGLYIDASPSGGTGRSHREIAQELLIASGSSGDFVTGRSVPVDGRVTIYLRNRGIKIEGVTFRDVSTGFKVTPVVTGDGKISIDIEPFLSYFADERRGEIVFKEARTSVVSADGRDVVIASNDSSGGDLVYDVFSGFSGGRGDGRYYFAINASIEK
ncbi:MAG: hypothetical protein JW984_03800 [Deltaproteobacteria bacterium]|uniref:NolW-like domain-containing protein n=1 Tax=Candidatus Zymogenus saltonus TaxID=2844893 RepID=A0A9D8KB61_9DELT|nr:hypothetical protein [Candidatus Zymogenus saltonus]